MKNKKYLFYFVHPAKFHLFRRTINELKSFGHTVDICINAKDMLEELVKSEGWDYTCLFPKGRRIKGFHTYLNAAVNTFVTIFRLIKYTSKRERYDLFITDDLLTVVGMIKFIPTIYFTDDDLTAVPESIVLLISARYVLCPNVVDIWKFKKKKIGFDGYKSLGHLHPNSFRPNPAVLPNEMQNDEPFFFIRCVSATSTHDVGKRGLPDELLLKIVRKLESKGNIIINTQRVIPKELRKYVMDLDKKHVAQYIYRSLLFIGDSNSMCYESAILGTPSIEIDDWYCDFSQYKELNAKYGLMFGYFPDQEDSIFGKIDELLRNLEIDKNYYKIKREHLLSEKIDLSGFMIWLFNNYPDSIKTYFNRPSVQKEFCLKVF